MSLQAAGQLLQELESTAQPPTDVKEFCQVLGSLLESHEQVSEQAPKFNQVSSVVGWLLARTYERPR